MTSSMLSGEKRWASQRRSGMTVLGKVAVPKPINLPSQRLENHGLDPNVEIVPKGTLSWGSKSSSSPNAWGSSTLSPKADGGGGSPSHLSARPSSGGSGTRPSTAGSDRAHEPVNAWGPSSRPSSASGAITTNQTSSASLRPRSADTRPGSSQLSRFAESVSESSGAWSATGTAEKLGIASSKNEGFSLTSGDFPTLGSEKDTTDHRAHSRPGSSSSEIAAVKERIGDVAVGVNARSGTADSWRRDSPTCPEDGVRPGVEKWHADPHGPHPFPNAGIPPQHYDAWHAPPVNNHPGGVWYNRGPPGGLPYRSPVPPGGFPMEPIHYYGPQVPGPQPVPPPGAGPRGHPSNNGAMFRPPMADAYVRPGMPMRPGFYPPPVPYEGFYGPPMGYCNTNERDIQFMGMTAGPAPYNRFPAPNAPDMGSSHPRASGYGHSGKALAPEHVESGHPHETRGQYKVLLKQHDGWDNKEEQKWKDKAPTSVDKDGRWEGSSWENDTKTVYKGEETNLQRTVVEEAPHSIDERRGVSVAMKVKLPEIAETAKAYDSASKGMEYPASSSEVSMASKDSSLIQKIEDLNVKARVSGGRHDPHYVSNREEQKNKIHVDAKANHSRNEGAIGSGAVYPERSRGVNSVSDKADRSHDSVAATEAVISRRSTHGVLSRNDHRSKGRFDSQEIDAWQKKPAVLDASSAKPAGDLEISNLGVRDHSTGSAEKSVLSQARDEGEPAKPIYDPSDNDTQRARMRELAQQRVKQRQKEEEEREREQKAKALAKLEELNRRTQGLEISAQKMGADSASAVLRKQEEPRTLEVVNMPPGKSDASGYAVVSDSNVVSHIGQSVSGVQKVTVLSDEPPSESTKTATKEPSEKDSQSLSLQEGVSNADPRPHNSFTQAMDVNAPKQKRVSYRQKHNAPSERSSEEKLVSTGATELQKHPTDAAPNAVSSAEVVANEPVSNTELNSAQNIMKESLMPQRRKNGRNSRNKQKVEETSSEAALPSGSEKESRITNNAVEGDKPKSSGSERAPRSVHSLGDSQSSEKESSLPTEEFHGRANNQWKSQHSRWAARNPQSHKPVEKFHNNDAAVVWAPVRSHNRSEATEEVNQQKTEVEAGASSAKTDPQLQNTQRNKRAELERYVPKPAAKEISQHGNIQQPVAPSENQPSVDDTFRRGDRRSHGPAAVTEPRGGDSKQNRQGRKGYGSWNQHASTEPTSQGMLDGQSSNSNKMTYKSTEQQEYEKVDTNIVKEQPKNDEWDDGWFMPEPLDSAVQPSVPVVKDQREATRGKRHTMKGHRGGVGNNHEFDHKKATSGEVEKHHTSQPPVAITIPTDLPATSKESRAVGDRSSSHWQPKSSSRPENGQNVGSENGRGNRRDSNSRGRVPYNEGLDQPPQDLPLSRKGNVEERRPGSAKGRPYSPNMELPMEIRPEQRMPRRIGNQNNRYGRGQQESHGEWNSTGQERHPPANRDRQRHTTHYEYQPVGPQHNNNRPNNPEGPKDGSHNAGPRFRERGQGQGPSRRGGGNFHGRQSSNNVRVDDGGHD